MPLVRISYVEGKSAQFALQLSQGVHRAMVETFNVPADDYFRIVTDHAASRGVIGPASFLGIALSEELVMDFA
jgi:4-oxalocrotonate tautomerase